MPTSLVTSTKSMRGAVDRTTDRNPTIPKVTNARVTLSRLLHGASVVVVLVGPIGAHELADVHYCLLAQ